jgi:ubiquinone/menaquinone biosynthesis C-methylase UbiE
MSSEKRNFDKEAFSWDENPVRVKLAKDVAEAIIKHTAITPEMDALDFGCGTGLITLQLRPLVHSITGVDSSQGMLEQLKMKITGQNLTNVYTQLVDIEKEDFLNKNYHFIVSSMTLHHVKEIQPLLQKFYNRMAPGGYLCIADLDLDNGQFHSDSKGVFHSGFDREKLGVLFAEAGFDDIRSRTAARIVKPVSGGAMRDFTVFLLSGRKI